MESNESSKSKGRHLSINERITIESMLNAGETAYAIAKDLGKAPSTISREINNHIHSISADSACIYYRRCKRKHICGMRYCHHSCKECTRYKCEDNCSHYTPAQCDHPELMVCNSCAIKTKCSLEKRFYYAIRANNEYKKTLVNKRNGFDITDTELMTLDGLISPLIKQGLTPYHISIQLADKVKISSSTIYRLIESGLLTARNIDLPEKVKRKPRLNSYQRKIRQSKATVSALKKGREYKDYLEYVATNDVMTVQMDCVEGKVEDNATILSLHWTELHMQLFFIMNAHSSEEVVATLDKIESSIGIDLFEEVFPLILTDNGQEFWDIYGMERSCLHEGRMRTKIFFCEPNRSDEKGACERNHRLLRKIIPKGTSLERYTQCDMTLATNHVNSYFRKSLGGKSPYNIAKQILPGDFFTLLGLETIPGDKVILNPSILK